MLKLPSQMLGMPFPGSAGGECFRSEVAVLPPCWRRGGTVGSGRVGSSKGVGTPVDDDDNSVDDGKYIAIDIDEIMIIIN